MACDNLRDWIQALEKAGELQHMAKRFRRSWKSPRSPTAS